MDTVSLTYSEIAERLGITRKSAENLRRRKGWATTKGNDRRVRIMVPLDALTNAPSMGEPMGTSIPPKSLPEDLIKITQLEGTVERWQAEAHHEKSRRQDIERERDHWREQATRSLWNRLFNR